jgi:membrane-associated phospholipid phosphatase
MRYPLLFLAVSLAVAAPGARLLAQEEESSLPGPVPEIQTEALLEEGDTLAVGQQPSPAQSGPAWYSMITNIPGDWITSGKMAFRSDGLPVLGGIAVATGLLMVSDHQLYAVSHNAFIRSSDVRFASNQLIRAGDGRTTVGIAAAFGLYGFAAGDSRALRTASGTIEALLASGIAVQLLKHISGRESPQVATELAGEWRPFPGLRAYNSNQPRYYAFPSGHITTAMATVTVIAENYPDAGWIRPVGYSIVGLTGISLVNKGWHWYSDFPLAIALGYTFGKIASHHDDGPGSDMSAGPAGTKLNVSPSIGPRGPGVMLALRF